MKKIYSLLVVILLTAVITVSASAPLLVDNADLLEANEEATLLVSLENTSEELDMDVVIVTVDSFGGKSARAYADDYYDYNGYSPNGVLLVVSMSEREWYISTTGTAINAVTNREVEQLGEVIVPYLSDGAYLDGFLVFCSNLRKVAVQQQTGTAAYKDPMGWLVCVGIGIVVGLISVLVMKSRLKSVRGQSAAANYVVRNSFRLTGSHDLFLFQNVTRTPKPQDSGTHRGSSGRSHGGGGGRF